MAPLDIIYIRDLKNLSLLPYKRNSSIRNWLKKNGVTVFGDKNCKRPYILKEMFEKALLSERIKNLRDVYGNKWMDVLKNEMRLKAQYQAVLDEIQNAKCNSPLKKVESGGKAQEQFTIDTMRELELASKS